MAGASPNIGSIYGIPIELHWTFIVMMLLALAISVNLFIIFVLLFVCVFLHELAHSVTAIRNNISVKKIILYPLGGGSMIDMDEVPPKLEFMIAIALPPTAAIRTVLQEYWPRSLEADFTEGLQSYASTTRDMQKQ